MYAWSSIRTFCYNRRHSGSLTSVPMIMIIALPKNNPYSAIYTGRKLGGIINASGCVRLGSSSTELLGFYRRLCATDSGYNDMQFGVCCGGSEKFIWQQLDKGSRTFMANPRSQLNDLLKEEGLTGPLARVPPKRGDHSWKAPYFLSYLHRCNLKGFLIELGLTVKKICIPRF